jgi:Carbohydrate family 9 binding domain-like
VKSSALTSRAPPGQRRSNIKTQVCCALGLLALAGLACAGGGTDVQATVNAVDTAVELTVGAMTQPAGSTPAPASATPQATLGIATYQAPTGVPPTKPPATHAPPTAAPTAPEGDQPVRPNWTLLHAAHRASPPNIDAQGNDWPSPLPDAINQIVFGPQNWTGPADQSGTFAMGWDANNLYLFVAIIDDVHVQTQHGETLFEGDSLELQFDADLAGDFATTHLTGDDYQLGFSPGENRDAPEAFLWNPAARKGVPAGIVMASRAGSDSGGFVFETAIPWSFFGVSPVAGQHFGVAFNSSDNDSPGTALQQSMVSSVVTRKLLDPTSWGTVQLDP